MKRIKGIIKMNKKLIKCYDTDASQLFGKAEKVIFPRNIEEIQQIFKTSGLDIVPRGSGTNLVGGCVPHNSIVVDMCKMNVVSKFEPIKKTVHVEPGVTLKELNEKLNAVGFEFPSISINQGISTIGGLIARNSFVGFKSSFMRDWIEEIEFVDGRGNLVKTSKTDLTDVCGMEGITGIIVGATLKVILKEKRTASVFQTENIDELLLIARRLKSEAEVISLEFFSPKVSKMLGLPEKYNLIIEFNSDRGKIKGEDYKALSKVHGKVYSVVYSNGYPQSEDFKFFFDKLKEFILYLESNKTPYFGFIDSGIIHPFFKNEDKYKKQEINNFVNKVKAKTNGYGIGLTRKNFLDSSEIKIIKRIKSRHDPLCKLNRNKIIDAEPEKAKFSYGEHNHIKPIEKKEFEEIKSFMGEDITASELEKGMNKETGEKLVIKEPVSKLVKLPENNEIKKIDAITPLKNYPDKRKGQLSEKEQKIINDIMFGGFGLKSNKEEPKDDLNDKNEQK